MNSSTTSYTLPGSLLLVKLYKQATSDAKGHDQYGEMGSLENQVNA